MATEILDVAKIANAKKVIKAKIIAIDLAKLAASHQVI